MLGDAYRIETRQPFGGRQGVSIKIKQGLCIKADGPSIGPVWTIPVQVVAEEERQAADEVLFALTKAARIAELEGQADGAVNSVQLYHDCWRGLADILEDFGLDKKAQPAEAQAWLREKLGRIAELEAACAAKDEALNLLTADGGGPCEWLQAGARASAALSPDAGHAYAEKKQALANPITPAPQRHYAEVAEEEYPVDENAERLKRLEEAVVAVDAMWTAAAKVCTKDETTWSDAFAANTAEKKARRLVEAALRGESKPE